MRKVRFLAFFLAPGLFCLMPDALADWGPAQRLTWNSGMSENPAIAIDANNTIHVVWDDSTPGNYEIYYRQSTTGGTTWSTPGRLTWTSGDSLAPAIAIDSSNALHVVWYDNTPGNYEIYYKDSPDGGASWSPSQRLTWTPGSSKRPVIAIDSNKNLHVAWDDDTPGTPEIYYTNSSDGGATWSAARRLTWISGESPRPALATDSNNAIHVVWYDYTISYYYEIFYKKSTDGGATWSAARRLTWTSNSSAEPAVGIDSTNGVHVVWEVATPGNWEIYYKKSPDGGTTWSPPKRLTWTSNTSWKPCLAIDSTSAIHVAWYDNTPGNWEIYYKKSPDGGTTWSPPKRLTWTSIDSYYPALATDSINAIHVVWEEYAPSVPLVEIYYKKGT